ncbi:hypothetical protein [Anderseniella sp. Alg231-50]|uniref:hypothetical protein n=1 Tax=Anderseniella sp. Alg231-50 TaxID=1922226 RepID=UPI00307B2F84
MPKFDPSSTIIGADFRRWCLLTQNFAGVPIIAGNSDERSIFPLNQAQPVWLVQVEAE